MVDFLDRDDQEMIDYCERVLDSAARHHLHIQFHGSYKPSGEQRTFPHLFNREGVLNLEYLKWSKRCTPPHNVGVAYTRLLAGPLDYHLGGFHSAARDRVSAAQSESLRARHALPPSGDVRRLRESDADGLRLARGLRRAAGLRFSGRRAHHLGRNALRRGRAGPVRRGGSSQRPEVVPGWHDRLEQPRALDRHRFSWRRRLLHSHLSRRHVSTNRSPTRSPRTNKRQPPSLSCGFHWPPVADLSPSCVRDSMP